MTLLYTKHAFRLTRPGHSAILSSSLEGLTSQQFSRAMSVSEQLSSRLPLDSCVSNLSGGPGQETLEAQEPDGNFDSNGRTAKGFAARFAVLTQHKERAMPKLNRTTSSRNSNIVSLTPSQKEFIKLLLDERIHESGQNDDLDYYINVEIKGRWTKLIWLPSEVQPLVDAGFLYQFPNRWNQEHLVVVVNEDCRAELTLAVLL